MGKLLMWDTVKQRMNNKQAKKFRKEVKKLWQKEFGGVVNKMNFYKRLKLALRIIRKDF